MTLLQQAMADAKKAAEELKADLLRNSTDADANTTSLPTERQEQVTIAIIITITILITVHHYRSPLSITFLHADKLFTTFFYQFPVAQIRTRTPHPHNNRCWRHDRHFMTP
jgi:hypothetical protein